MPLFKEKLGAVCLCSCVVGFACAFPCVFLAFVYFFVVLHCLTICCGQFVAGTHEPAKAQNLSIQTHVPTFNPSSQSPMPQHNVPSPKT